MSPLHHELRPTGSSFSVIKFDWTPGRAEPGSTLAAWRPIRVRCTDSHFRPPTEYSLLPRLPTVSVSQISPHDTLTHIRFHARQDAAAARHESAGSPPPKSSDHARPISAPAIARGLRLGLRREDDALLPPPLPSPPRRALPRWIGSASLLKVGSPHLHTDHQPTSPC